MTTRHILAGLAVALSVAAPAFSQDSFQLHGAPTDVYSSGVTVLPDRPVYFSSGVPSNPKDGGTMREQALASMKRLEANIAAAGFSLSDVVYVRAYLMPGVTGTIDYAGWDTAWSEVFNTPKTPKPARTTVGVPSPRENGGLIEVEYVCATKDSATMAAASSALALPVTNSNLKPFGTKEGRIYAGIGVVPGSGMFWTAGLTAPVINKEAPATSYESRGNMYTQARNTLAALKKNIEGAGLTLADVVFVRAFLGPDHNMGGKFDVDGWNRAYGEFFNNPEQPHKPARTTATTPTFASNAGGLTNSMIEIEFVAAYPKAPASFEGSEAGKKVVHIYGAPTAMFASGVATRPGKGLYFSSGALPTVGGDMKTQALSALESLKSGLAKAGASFADTVFLRAYLVPNADGTVDRNGWNEAYSTFFNNPAQPNKPGRVTIPVSSVPKADSKIAIDIVAVVP